MESVWKAGAATVARSRCHPDTRTHKKAHVSGRLRRSVGEADEEREHGRRFAQSDILEFAAVAAVPAQGHSLEPWSVSVTEEEKELERSDRSRSS
jgi:hypothetical protein